MYCRYCGENNPDEAVFCKNCGKKLKEEVKKPEVITHTTNQNNNHQSTTTTNTSSNDNSDWIGCCMCLIAIFILFAIMGSF